MNEFETFLKSKYGLKDGDEVPDDVYEKASAEFVQSRSTVPSISPGQSAWSLDKAIPNPAPQAQTQPQQATPDENPLAGLLPEQVNVLSAYWGADRDFRDLVQNTGLKDREKTQLTEEWQYTDKTEWEPALKQVGLSLPEAKFAIERANKVSDKAGSLSEALGATRKANPTQGLSPDQIEQLGKVTSNINSLTALANETSDPAQKIQYQKQIQGLNAQARQIQGLKDPSPYETYMAANNVLSEIEEKKKLGGGTVSWNGVTMDVNNAAELEQTLTPQKADALYALQKDPSSVRVSPQAAAVFKKIGGKDVIDEEATSKKYDELLAKAQPGEPVFYKDGSFGIYAGPTKEGSDKSITERWTPEPLKPAIKGAGVVGDKIATAIVDNVKPAVEAVGSGVKDYISYMNDQTLGRLPAVWLARKGLDYLSAVGKRAEEEEKKKKLAGQ